MEYKHKTAPTPRNSKTTTMSGGSRKLKRCIASIVSNCIEHTQFMSNYAEIATTLYDLEKKNTYWNG